MTHQQLIDTIQTYHPDANTELLARAYTFSERMHQGQKRRSGEPYFVHPVEVAKLLTTMKLDVPTVITGLLHDTVEDTLTTPGRGRAAVWHRGGRSGRWGGPRSARSISPPAKSARPRISVK